MQNAVDAITARHVGDPGAPGAIHIYPPESTGDGTLRVEDTGIGLTEAQVHELLATIGRSSKRDDLGFARHEFLGQFGIGLLSCFEGRVRPGMKRARGVASKDRKLVSKHHGRRWAPSTLKTSGKQSGELRDCG
ncbi:ATP-binding protein [Micromonospora sp. NPDC049102]|uniref:ATP-binding protein n=1 Tax=Micromonospora sp. NPDC049102 TaxID=3364265 RepID=UPI00371293D3